MEENKNSVLIVDDEDSNIMALTHILGETYTIYAVKDGQDAIEVAEEFLPDVILLDIVMPEMDGYMVIAELKRLEKTRNIPVIFITGLSNSTDEEKGLSLGAADYIGKPFSPAIVKLRISNQIKMLNQLRTIEFLSLTDQLTRVPNRRAFDERMEMEWKRAIRVSTPLSFLILDIDKFKVFNDTYGHQQGDVTLQAVATSLKESVNRPGDFAARWGGEEFVALLPNTDKDGALSMAEKIRIQISELIILCEDGTETKVTVSIGVNTRVPQVNDVADHMLSAADKALYRAKETGRNRVCHADENE
jgi:diguanylate cyclase (GGDEF)-like protein